MFLIRPVGPVKRIKEIQGVNIDKKRCKDKRYIVKKIYQITSNPDSPNDANSLQWRVNVVRYLEKLLKTYFKRTKDFKQKIFEYLDGYDFRKMPDNLKLIKIRKKMKLTQTELGKMFGYKSHVPIVNFERGKRRIPKRILEWLEKENVTKK